MTLEKIGRVVDVNEKRVLYRMLPHVSGGPFNAYFTFYDTLKDTEKIPDYLKMGENYLNEKEWKSLMADRNEYFDTEKGSFRLSVYKNDISELISPREGTRVANIQAFDPDILVVEDYMITGKYGKEVFDIVGFAKTSTDLIQQGKSMVIVPYLTQYNRDIISVLNTALSQFTDDSFIERYPFLNISKIEPENAIYQFRKKPRKIFAISKKSSMKDMADIRHR
ncbi:MAG: hypothetical protein ABIG84_06130 [archaeon]